MPGAEHRSCRCGHVVDDAGLIVAAAALLEEPLALAAAMSISFCLSFGDSIVHSSDPMCGGRFDPFLALTGLPVDSL